MIDLGVRFGAAGTGQPWPNVDAQNETGAADLYRAMGMREHRRFLIYERPLAGDISERPIERG